MTCLAPNPRNGLRFGLLNLSSPLEPSGLGSSAIASMLNEFGLLYLYRGHPGDPILMFESELHLKAAH